MNPWRLRQATAWSEILAESAVSLFEGANNVLSTVRVDSQ